MERLLGIVIPDEIKVKIMSFCKQYTPRPAEPYMALFSSDRIREIKGFDSRMQSFCLSQAPFKTIIGGPNLEHSDSGTILYLSVMMGPLNSVRGKLEKYLHLQGGEFFRAQLVVLSYGPDAKEDFNNMLLRAKDTFSKAQEFSVTEFAMYVRESENDSFKIDAVYPFTGR